jgi:hypothetical protein
MGLYAYLSIGLGKNSPQRFGEWVNLIQVLPFAEVMYCIATYRENI